MLGSSSAGGVRNRHCRASRLEEKVVVVNSEDDTPYSLWISVTSAIEDAGGIITLQLEEEREVQVP